MAKSKKLIRRILSGRADANISFTGLCGLLTHLGFVERVRGDHHIFAKDGIDEILNLQPKKALAKPYQVRQVRKIIVQYRLGEKTMAKYEIIIYWSNEDQAFVAEVPELPGCMADGKTYQEAIANAEVVMEQWIATAKELGRTIPEPKGRLRFA